MCRKQTDRHTHPLNVELEHTSVMTTAKRKRKQENQRRKLKTQEDTGRRKRMRQIYRERLKMAHCEHYE